KATPARADWTKATVKELVADLGHPNLTVRLTATHQLTKRGVKDVIDAVGQAAKDVEKPEASSHALWVLERLGTLDDGALKQAAAAKAEAVRVHAQRILSERPKWAAWERDLAVSGLKDTSPHVQRASADALAQHADAANVRPLLDLLHKVPARDTHLRHGVR